jgi:hypothetical protein
VPSLAPILSPIPIEDISGFAPLRQGATQDISGHYRTFGSVPSQPPDPVPISDQQWLGNGDLPMSTGRAILGYLGLTVIIGQPGLAGPNRKAFGDNGRAKQRVNLTLRLQIRTGKLRTIWCHLGMVSATKFVLNLDGVAARKADSRRLS